ncbi:MAG: hypothetical protein HN919_05405 [Verrucomicrobia bacterium]|jgi:hypothetical protein|nr:hypothetical protein [Verrucomicrobiota bacterium]MBT7065716.1 hypothetical protein [Verrucomicrobiota bacterium]MBT7701992.1 hypothetical protein [Verrucomicrobiota bacterium]
MSDTAKNDTIDRDKFVTGYTRVSVEEGEGSYSAGYSIYTAAWPLLREYPGHEFQSGLFGTWMFADSTYPKIEGVWTYSTLEGGLGWWRDTEFPTETPKFIMGAVALGFCAWANGPGAGKGRDWDDPKGHYGIAQLSPNLLWPPDGVNLKQGTCGQVLGYGYQPLPLTQAKPTTAGADVPTGDQCWTLFLNAGNFKGPATFVLPYFYSEPTVAQPRTAGLFLDSVPAKQNRHHAMETQYIPWAQATDQQGRTFARMAPTLFPAGQNGAVPALQQVTAYNRHALWDRAKAWLDGGDPADSVIDQAHAYIHKFDESGGVQWATAWPGLAREDRIPLAASDFIRPSLNDPYSLAYAAQSDLVKPVEGTHGQLMMLPEYYQLIQEGADEKGQWVAVAPEEVPSELALDSVDFGRPEEAPPQTYVTPDDPESCWKQPGPVAGPFTAEPGDGSQITYYWYRFADQPALLNADLTDEEREALQVKVEKIHRHWTKDRDYLAPPKVGELAEIDPALIVTPPEGFEIGYVPIATRQGKRS